MSIDVSGIVDTADPALPRRRFVVAWRDSSKPAISPIGCLDYVDGRYSFAYVPGASQIPDFRPLLEFPSFARTYVSDDLFPFFAQRIMDSRRPDYPAYVEALALPLNASALDVLGRSGGRRKADKVQVMEIPREAADGTTTFDFLVHGSRFSPVGEDAVSVALSAARPGDELALLPEPENPVNPNALLVVTAAGVPIGWVPDLLLPFVNSMLDAGGWQLSVLRVNGPEVAWQLRLVAHLTGPALRRPEPFGDSPHAVSTVL